MNMTKELLEKYRFAIREVDTLKSTITELKETRGDYGYSISRRRLEKLQKNRQARISQLVSELERAEDQLRELAPECDAFLQRPLYPRDKTVLRLYYACALPDAEIGDHLHMTGRSACRIRHEALIRLGLEEEC